MRKPRGKLCDNQVVYHCYSRIVGGDYLIDELGQAIFHSLMWKRAAFGGIQIISFVILSGHYHIVARVLTTSPLTDAELLERVANYYGQTSRQAKLLRKLIERQGQIPADLRHRYERRMGNISEFNKDLKQNFSIWYNQQHERFGTLWAERFGSVTIEDRSEQVLGAAAYADLNPVRAALVEDPKDYAYCGYAEALAQEGPARAGLSTILPGDTWEEKAAFYRLILMFKGAESKSPDKKPLDRQLVLEEIEREGKLSLPELLRLKLRFMTRGVVLGSKEFVERMFEKCYGSHYPKRKQVAFKIPGLDGEWFTSLVVRKGEEAFFGPLKKKPPDPKPGSAP